LTIAVLVPLSAVFLSGAIPPSLAAARSEGLRLHADCVLLNSGMNDASLIYESAVRLWPDNWRAHYQLGIAARERGDSHTSVSHFREIVRSKPDDAGIRLLLGVELVASGDLNGARDEILRSLEVSGPNVVTLTQLAIVDCALGRHDQALHSLERALGLEPGNAKVRRMIEQIHQSQSLP
ncbi:MAG: tetratricopeptide repeat protein, partial [Pirellulales bacterium]